jgi:hypothetical protein
MVLLAAAVEACTGGTNSPITNPTFAPSGNTFSLGSSTIVQGFTAGSVSGSIIYPTGSGSLSGTVATTPPSGIAALSSVLRAPAGATAPLSGTRAAAAASPSPAPNAPLIYVTYAGTATLSGLPGISVTLPSGAPTGTSYYEAEWNGTQWLSVGGAGSSSGTTVTFNAGTTPITLGSSTPIYVSIYSGVKLSLPTPTPSPSPSPTATPTPGATATPALLVSDGGFESNSVAAIGAPVTSTGWTQCTVTSVSPGISYTGGISGTGAYAAATAPPVSTFTPIPGSTPAAVIVPSGASAPAGTDTPVPTQVTSPVHGGGYAAQFGQLFSTYNAGDYRYNGLCQNVTAPAGGANLTAYVFESGNEGSTYVEDLIGTMSSSTNLSNILYMENIETSAATTDTGYRKIGPIAIPGGSTTLFLGMWTKSGSATGATYYSSYWWVDDLSIVSN